jgi:hypothetical protein
MCILYNITMVVVVHLLDQVLAQAVVVLYADLEVVLSPCKWITLNKTMPCIDNVLLYFLWQSGNGLWEEREKVLNWVVSMPMKVKVTLRMNFNFLSDSLTFFSDIFDCGFRCCFVQGHFQSKIQFFKKKLCTYQPFKQLPNNEGFGLSEDEINSIQSITLKDTP